MESFEGGPEKVAGAVCRSRDGDKGVAGLQSGAFWWDCRRLLAGSSPFLDEAGSVGFVLGGT